MLLVTSIKTVSKKYICDALKISFDNTEIAFASKSNKALKRAYWLFKLIGSNSLVKFGKWMMNIALTLRIPIGWAIKPTIFNQFCGGEIIKDCEDDIKNLADYGIGTILDYSVEGKKSDEDFEQTTKEIIATIALAKNKKEIPFSVFKVTGIARFGLLEKVNENSTLSEGEQQELEEVKNRVKRICQNAYDADTPVFIDAEESWIQDTIDDIALEMMQEFNREKAIVYNTVQLYRWDRLGYLKNLIKGNQGIYIGLKLVRGAYMEKERVRAEERGYECPIQASKENTDKDYNSALEFCIDNLEKLAICAGTHNEKSSLYLTELMAEKGLKNSDARIFFAQLFGMSDHISFNLSYASYNVVKYLPYGPIKEVIPYLIRRAEENTSVAGQTSRELRLIQEERKRRKLA